MSPNAHRRPIKTRDEPERPARMTMINDALTGADARRSAGGRAALRIAVLDTDSGFLRVLSKRLEGLGWQYRVLGGPAPVDAMVAMRLSALVVDLAVLGPQGWSWLETLCARLPGLGVIVCTGPSSVAQRVRGLRLGVDDWLSKPCHAEELIARVEAVVRRRKRAEARADAGPLAVGEMEIRVDQFQAFVGGVSAGLTRRDFELLQLLAVAEGKVLEREEIYQRVWGYAMARGDRSVDVFVRKLRSKLEKASPDWRYIHTHFGVGYRFAPERVHGAAAPAAGGRAAAALAHSEAAPGPDAANDVAQIGASASAALRA